MAIVSPAAAVSRDWHRVTAARTQVENDRILKKKTPTAATTTRVPLNCCDIVKKVLALDQACKAAVVDAEEAGICLEDSGTLQITTAAAQLDVAFTQFNTFILSFINGNLDVTPEFCFPDGGDALPLSSFGDWCVLASITDGVLDYAPPGPLEDLGIYLVDYAA
jgi:hypothetical protein